MSGFEEKLGQSIQNQDGVAISEVLSVHSKLHVSCDINEHQVRHKIRRHLDRRRPQQELKQWADVGIAYWKCRQELTGEDFEAQFKAQNELLKAINRVADKTGSWILPIFYTVSKELRQSAVKADWICSTKNDLKISTVNLEEAVRTINKSFTLCLNDRTPDLSISRKWGVYFIVGELFKIYFQLNNRALAKSVRNVLKQQQLPPLEKYPKSHILTFLYYTGVMMFIDEDYEGAQKNLMKAMSMFPSETASSTNNKELILKYLIPIQVLTKRRTPSQALWTQFSKLEVLYRSILDALMAGDLKTFDQEVLLRRRLLIKKHIYLSICKIRMLVFSRLFRKVYLIQGQPNRIATPIFGKALRISCGRVLDPTSETNHEEEDPDFRGDQIECYLTQLISSGQMKGYISRERQTIVLRNKDAFPKVHPVHTL